MNLRQKSGGILACGLLLLLAGCRISVNKSESGEDKDVKVDTPLGGVHVRTDDTVAADIGLPAYPGATLVTQKDGDHPADVRLGFGDWQLHVKVAKYHTADPQEKVLAFYKGALARYGDVLQCDRDKPVGEPARTRTGLTCKDGNESEQVHVSGGEGSIRLKAGSPQHQYLMGIDRAGKGGTDFSVVALDLPHPLPGEQKESN